MKIISYLVVTASMTLSLAHAQQAPTRIVPVGTPAQNQGAPMTGQAQAPRPANNAQVNVTGAKNSSFYFEKAPSIDSGPSDLIPTDLFMKRTLTADYEGRYTQEASIHLPVYYHSAYLNLSPEDQQQFKQLDVEFRSLLTEYESMVNRFADFMVRYNALNERGRPRGVIEPSQFLVPYSGNGTTVQDPIDPLRITRKNPNTPNPNVQMSPQRIVPLGQQPIGQPQQQPVRR